MPKINQEQSCEQAIVDGFFRCGGVSWSIVKRDTPFISREVAEFIEKEKGNLSIYGALKEAIKEGFLNGSRQQEVFAKAWLYGYEVRDSDKN